VAKDLGVQPSDVIEMEKRLASHDASFDGTAADDEDDVVSPALYIEDQRNGPEQQMEMSQNETGDHENLKQALESLDDRSQTIIRKRWLDNDKLTLQELAGQFNVSAERIRQLEVNAMKSLKQAMLPV
jgi:RNA polymerase sigma-32 factor